MVNLRGDAGFARLALEIKDRAKGEAFDFYWSPGNWGDSLINHGARDHFKSYGLPFRELSRGDLTQPSQGRARVAVVGGGGGWSPAWNSTPEFLSAVAKLYEKVVLLPTSFDLRIAGLDLPNVTYFSRDTSVDPAKALYCPDMAFFLDLKQTTAPSLRYPLICLREDAERNSKSFSVPRNIDLSLLGDASDSIGPLVDVISKFERVYTDRMHIAITAGMLGREVFLLDGNYPKSRRVHAASMKEAMDNVRLMTWTEFRKDPVIRSRLHADFVRRTHTAPLVRVVRRIKGFRS